MQQLLDQINMGQDHPTTAVSLELKLIERLARHDQR